MNIKIYNEENAPEKSIELLKAAKENFGFIPNVLGAMAGSPATLKSYMDLFGNLNLSNLNAQEKEVLFLTISFENSCHYCMAAHTGGAKQAEVPEHIIQSLREGRELDDPKLNALTNLTRKIVQTSGNPSQSDIEDFTGAGYNCENVFDIITAVSMKTLSNYVNHIAETPLDEAFKAFEWKK